MGMSPGPIPFSSIDAYARRFGVEDEDFDHFTRMIRGMDQAILGWDGTEATAKPVGRPLSPDLFDAVFG
jgi:hypothetical protein